MLLPCEATLLHPKLPCDTFASATLAPCGDTLFLGAFLARRSRLCCFLKMNQTAVLFPSHPLQPHAKKIPPLVLFYPLFMSSIKTRGKQIQRLEAGIGSQHAPYSPDHSSSLRATPLSFSRARYSSTRSRLPSPAR